MNQISILSPHFDDAVLSCWHQIEQPDSQVITIFGGTPTQKNRKLRDVICGFSGAVDAINHRQLENKRALEGTPSTIQNLGYLDRLYDRTPPDITAMADAVLKVSSINASFVAPIGLGTHRRHHQDHVTVRDIGIELLHRGREVVFYADIPYMLPVLRHTSWPMRISADYLRYILGFVVHIEPVKLDKAIAERKRAAVRVYASQYPKVNVMAFGALSNPAAYVWEVLFRPQ